jgi:hypothetical protein
MRSTTIRWVGAQQIRRIACPAHAGSERRSPEWTASPLWHFLYRTKVLYSSIGFVMLLNLMPLTCFGQFSQRQLIDGNGFLSYPGSEGMTVADFDNDGRDDILIVARYYQYLYPGNVLDLNPNSASAGYRLMILKNDGFGFETEVDVLPPSDLSIDFLETADFDGNGFRDIMILRQGDIQMLFNFGPAGFQSTVIELDFTVNLDYRPYTADFNGDGITDVVARNASVVPSVQLLYAGTTGQQFLPPVEIDISSEPSGYRQILDYNSDGFDDKFKNGELHLNNGDLTFTETQLFPSECKRLFDVDGDSHLDCVLYTSIDGPTRIGVAFNSGVNTYLDTVIIGDYSAAWAQMFPDIIWTDFESDGDLDLTLRTGVNGSNTLRRFENVGGQSFQQVGNTSCSAIGFGLGSGLIGMEQFYITCGGDSYSGSIYGRRLELLKVDASGSLENLGWSVTDNKDTYFVEDRDIDFDGIPDLLLVSDDTLRYMLGFGNGDFAEAEVLPTDLILNSAIQALEFADIDSDGDEDIFLATWGYLVWLERTDSLYYPRHVISSLDGVFTDFCVFTTETGYPNICVQYSANATAPYLNNGQGIFTNNTWNVNFAQSTSKKSRDIDGDGDLDVVSLCQDGTQLKSGTFGATLITDQVSASDFEFLDVDADGLEDIVTAQEDSGVFVWLRRTGPGQFSAPQPLNINSSYNLTNLDYLEAGDIDGDGDNDLFYDLGYLLNLGAGEFQLRFIDQPSYLTGNRNVVDVDGDGDADLVVAEDFSLWWYESLFNSPYRITGRTYHDANANGSYDGGDSEVASIGIDLLPNQSYAFSTDSGIFEFIMDSGAYQVVPSFDPALWTLSSDSAFYLAVVNSTQPVYSGADFGFVPNGIQPIANAEVTISFPRCDQVVHHWVSVLNEGNTLLNGTLQYTLDPALNFVSSSPAPDSMVGNVLHYSMSSLGFGFQHLIDIQVGMPGATSLYVSFTHELLVLNDNGDTLDQENRTHGIFCSYDPNDKLEEKGLGTPGYVLAGDELEYTVRFQNTGNDTAYTVVIRDALSDKLLWHTLQPIAWSHPVQTSVSASGDVTFTFENIYLVDSMTNPLGSQGFIKFRITTRADLQPGEQIHNTANIYFDQNPPITTNTELNTIFECGQLSAFSITQNEACAGQIMLNAWGDAWEAANYEWSLGDSIIYSGNHLVMPLQLNGSQWLRVAASSELCPMMSDSVQLTIAQPYTPTIQISQFGFCEGDTLFATDLSIQDYFRQWHINGVGVSYSDTLNAPLEAGNAIIVLKASGSVCPTAYDTASVQVNAFPLAMFVFADDSICADQSVSINSQGSVGLKEWYVNDEYLTQGGLQNFDPDSVGNYIFKLVTTTDHCPSDSLADTLTVLPLPEVALSYDSINETIVALPADYESYFWYVASGTFGMHGNELPFIQNGLYRVRVTDEFGCKTLSEWLPLSVGVDDSNPIGLQILPNPNTGNFEVICSNSCGIYAYQLMDLSGRMLKSSQLPLTNNRLYIETNLPAGTYLLKLDAEAGSVVRKVVIGL